MSMKCSICNEECPHLAPDELFCGECGHDASAHIATASQNVFTVVLPEPSRTDTTSGPVVQSGTYSAEISRTNPGCLIFLVDHSGSMEEQIAGGTGLKKKDAVADAINRLLSTTILRCAKEGGVRHYFDIGLWSYGGTVSVQRAFTADLVSIIEVEQQPKRKEVRRQRFPDGAGGYYEQELEFAIWLEPVAHNGTPMRAAFEAVAAPLRNWISRHPDSYPPIIINITDGLYTDGNPAPVVQQLMQMGTSDGNVLVFNCHITSEDKTELLFPGDQTGAQLQGLQKELYEMSSRMPAGMIRLAQDKGYSELGADARGYVYNAKQWTMVDLLDIGTRVAQERMEGA